MYMYKSMGPFTATLPVAEVKTLVDILDDGPQWKTEVGHHRSNTFWKHVLPLLPPHVALAFDQPLLFQFSHEPAANATNKKQPIAGRHRHYPFLVGIKGKCSAQADGCPTTFACGFTEESIKTLLDDPCPETIELLVIVNGRCIHKKGQMYGQLRGVARDAAIQEFANAGKKPTEFAKASLSKASDSEYHSKNRGALVTKASAQNISREAKQKELIALGLTKCKLSNIPLAKGITETKDIEDRDKINDASQDFLGVIRLVELVPTFRMVLYTKPCLQLYHYLARGGRLILNCDATGNLLNFPMVDELKDKILHTKLAVSPKFPVVDGKHARDKQVSRFLSPLTMAEMVSNKNTAVDYCDFFSGFLTSVRCTSSSDTATECPLFIMTDCSVPLESGALMAFSSNEGMANTRIEYGNVVLLHLLYFDKAVADAEAKDSDSYSEMAVTLVARQVLDSLRKFTGIFLKECRSHVYRAPAHWMHSNKSAEFSGVKDRFEDLL
jgi:hypothetical protein